MKTLRDGTMVLDTADLARIVAVQPWLDWLLSYFPADEPLSFEQVDGLCGEARRLLDAYGPFPTGKLRPGNPTRRTRKGRP